jgi:hypothetical protein
MAQEPPIVASPTPAVPGSAGSERPIIKTAATIIEAIVLGVLGFGFGNYYLQLSRSEEVRWTHAPTECLNAPACTSGRTVIDVYKLGGNPEPRTRFLYAVFDPSINAIADKSVQKYDVSLLNWIVSPKKDPAIGTFKSLGNDDPEINATSAIDFELNQLETGQVYELTVLVRSNSANLANVGRFEIRDLNGHQIGYQRLRFRDQLHLYLVEGIVFGILLLAVSAIVITGAIWKGKRFFNWFT